MLEIYDCDSASTKPDVAIKLFIALNDYQKYIEPHIVERRDDDFYDVSGLNDPDSIILLGNTSIKLSALEQYWQFVGEDTHEKRMWNVPTYEQLVRTLKSYEGD